MGAPPGRLERYTFLVERSLGKRVAHALQEHGFTIVLFAEQFPDETPDEVWIARAAEEGWVVLTKDSEVRRRPNELLAIKTSGLRLFTLTRGTWTSDEMSAAFIAAARRIVKVLKQHNGPFIVRITRAGQVSKLYELAEEPADG